MKLETSVEGYRLVNINDYQVALHNIQHLCEVINPLRMSLLHNIKILEQQNKNSFAKSIRLLDRMEKMIEEVSGVKL